MLIESSDAGDPESFRETELFKKCQEIGIIPRSEAELAEIIRAKVLLQLLCLRMDQLQNTRHRALITTL